MDESSRNPSNPQLLFLFFPLNERGDGDLFLYTSRLFFPNVWGRKVKEEFFLSGGFFSPDAEDGTSLPPFPWQWL